MSGTLDVDPYLPNAYSKTRCRFDLMPTKFSSPDDDDNNGAGLPEIVADELLLKKDEVKEWEPEVRSLASSKKWLANYGLKRNKLDIQSLMQAIGFKKRDGFDYALQKPIPSKYVVGKGFVDKFIPLDGRTTNVAVSKEKMIQLSTRLKQAIKLFQRRMEWLTTESRRIFGVIQEAVVIIILDVKVMSPQQFDQYRCAVERVLKEQVSLLAKFNLYRATDEPKQFKPECTPVTKNSIDEAIDWLWTLDRTARGGITSTCESVMKAIDNTQASGIYLFTMGNSAETSMELMLTNCRNARKPLNIVAYNCVDSDHMKNLKALCKLTGGRFHAYGVIMEMESYDPIPDEEGSSKANVAVRKRTIGGMPAGAGVRPDVAHLFEEIEEGQSNVSQIEALIEKMPDAKKQPYNKNQLQLRNMSRHSDRAEEYMASRQWLETNGLKVKKLTFYDVLGKVAFRHCDGVVKVQRPPGPYENKTDANSQVKLVNAVYCDQFAHVKWKDGSIVHVQITPETHRVYEERVTGLLDQISNRLKWLQMGSRQLFGTVIERRFYIVIDTSGSMAHSLQFVKDKLFLLLQEQIRHKDAFNIISFGSKVYPWRDRLIEVNEENLKAAWSWIKNLDTEGSTNTFGAIKYALTDPLTEGIYLLTDGRPDHPPKSILAQVSLQRPVPIHTISFNCADSEANKFLYQLAKDTNGRYHYFSEHGEDIEGPDAYQSEDIRRLNEELSLGQSYLEKVGALRDECQQLQWKRAGSSGVPRFSLSRPKSAAAVLRPAHSLSEPFHSSTVVNTQLPTSHSAPALHTEHHIESWKKSSQYPRSYRSKKQPKRPSIASHTKTSILRALSYSNAMDWVLPETKSMLNRQFQADKRTLSDPETSQQNNVSRKTDKAQRKTSSKKTKKQFKKWMSSKMWLKRHGLKAKGLLLLDALSEAVQKDTVSNRIDPQVIDRLLGQMPIQHAEGKDSILSNPYLEDVLLEYENKLTGAIDSYKKYLSRRVWNLLTAEEREKFCDERENASLDSPADFARNRATLLESLERVGWPITESDITLIEDEIEQAKEFHEQSKDIRAASQDHEKREVASPYLSRPLKMKLPKPRLKIIDQFKSQKVAARSPKDGFYYDGIVTKSKDAHHVIVLFDSGEEEIVPKQFVIPTKGSIAVPTLLCRDYVLTLVKGPDNLPCYVPGQVVVTPKQRPQDGGKFYEVLLYNATKVSALRTSMVKIGKARYNFSTSYIRERETAGQRDGSDSENEEDDKAHAHDADNQQIVLDAIGKHSKHLEKLCRSIIDRQKDHKSRQKRLHKQMKQMQKEYKAIVSSRDENNEDRNSEDHSENDDDNPVQSIKFHSLDGIEVGDEVLARWMDEGWYYRCRVARRVSERTYMLQDSCGHIQQTSRDNIIADNDDLNAKLDESSYVIACHPNYYYSYAPGIVEEVFDDYSGSVRFYDGTRSIIEREDIFLIDKDTYDRDVDYVIQCEEEMIGQAVIARDDKSGEFKLGTIKSTSGKRQYKIEFADGTVTSQSCIHIFGVFSKQYKLNVGDHCLSVFDDKQLSFLPGTVTAISNSGVSIQFINGGRCDNVHMLLTFWLSDTYYEAAANFFKKRNSESRGA